MLKNKMVRFNGVYITEEEYKAQPYIGCVYSTEEYEVMNLKKNRKILKQLDNNFCNMSKIEKENFILAVKQLYGLNEGVTNQAVEDLLKD